MDRRTNLVFPIRTPDGRNIMPKRQWLWQKSRVDKALADDDLVFTDQEGEITVSYKQYLLNEEGEKRGSKPASIIEGIYTQHGTQEIVELFEGAHPFQFPKPTRLIKQILQFATNSEDLILDFFAGSCTTAQAVLELNREDGGGRKFIVVQLPEPTEIPDYRTIADIGKERIRRVIKRMNHEVNNQAQLNIRELPEDVGFKVFKLTRPNIQQWGPNNEDREADSYVEKLSLFNDPLINDWKSENVLWEIALREGFGLNARFTLRELPNGNKVYDVIDPDTGQQFLICLDDQIRADLIKQCELTPEQLFVCRDLALDDSAAANLALQCRLKTI
jgi:adenine-specific DNA-methyltransferase